MGVVLVLTGIAVLMLTVAQPDWLGQWMIETFPGLGAVEDAFTLEVAADRHHEEGVRQ